MDIKQRQGIVVRPVERLSEKQIRLIDQTSRTLLEDPGLRERLGTAARRTVETRFTDEQVAQRMLVLYDALRG